MGPGTKVAIIGAGVSGLVAVKSCLEGDLQPICYEQFDNIGGLWSPTEEYREGQGARLYENLISIFSKDMFAFSDFPFSQDTPPCLTHATIFKYLQRYCDENNLRKHIRLGTKVKKIRRSGDYELSGKWVVEAEDSEGVDTSTYDYLLICSGFFKSSRIPDIDGLGTFLGPIDHSKTFWNGQKYREKTVLVVGNSNSAGEIAVDISKYAKKVYLSVGQGTWVLPRVATGGSPLDQLLYRRSNYKSLAKLDGLMCSIANSRINHNTSGLAPPGPPSQGRTMINDDIQLLILCGKIVIVGQLIRLGEQEAEFVDRALVKSVDAILFATGYDWSLEFLDENVEGDEGNLPFYKMVFPVSLPRQSLAVIGCVDPEGPIPPVTELQCRLAVRVFNGKHKLPRLKVMLKDIKKWDDYVLEKFGRFKYRLPHIPYRDELAKELGVTPSWGDLIKAGPWLAYQYFFGPAFSYFHRIWGPNKWPGAKSAIFSALHHGLNTRQTVKVQSQTVRNRL
ncbi:dimethylaniline monooxygenase [N-oxide-forming] 2-like [Haliotis rufescens]|uniref:dimethylaniline monooxygenase [N-oxide-forming] 2-like n=1 Tax=Haliotis rufescens TaxID=6454 RepID=UPI00201EB2F0|nr:dimethylaniline monooxygenase [N-oxide-forming] 2-like [Haliotis rufescens]